MMFSVLLSCAILLLLSLQVEGQNKVVCYWADSLKGVRMLNQYEKGLCSHVIYSFATLDSNTLLLKGDYAAYNKLIKSVRSKDPNVKILLAIGGWLDKDKPYSAMVSTAANRKRFIDSVMKHVDENEFDGVDLDWEYPASKDKNNFGKLCKELKDRLNGKILSAAVYSNHGMKQGYDAPMMAMYLDFLNVMTYDLRGSWNNVAGVHCLQKRTSGESSSMDKLNVETAMQSWSSAGFPINKLIVGIPTYGRQFVLRDPNINGIGAPTTSGGAIGFDDFCSRLTSYKVVRDASAISPYAFKGNDWIGYEDSKSARYKGEYAKNQGFGGVMFWSLEQDDTDGSCGQGKFPIIKSARDGLMGAAAPQFQNQEPQTDSPPMQSQPMTTRRTTVRQQTRRTQKKTSKPQSATARCSGKVYSCDSSDKSKYVVCNHGRRTVLPVQPGATCKDTLTGITFVVKKRG